VGNENLATSGRRFGQYLRRIRESRRLSLDAVEEMTLGYQERVTKSHLSRIENGQAVPTFPRMFALSQVYGVPIASLAERFELDLCRQMEPVDLAGKTEEDLLVELKRLGLAGDYKTTIALTTAALDRGVARSDNTVADVHLHQVNALVQLRRYETAKSECEQLLNRRGLTATRRMRALLLLINCSYRLGRVSIARMALEEVERELERRDYPSDLEASAEITRGSVLFSLGQVEESAAAFQKALSSFGSDGDEFGRCKASLNLSQCLIDLGNHARARRLIREALAMAERQGYEKMQALAQCHSSALSYKEGDVESAEAHALRSNAIARPRDYYAIVFTNCYYLREIGRKRDDAAMINSNERTLRVYLPRVEPDLPEAIAYRTEIAGGREQ